MTPPMEYRRLGKTGLKVSVLSLGSWATFGASRAAGAAGVDIDAAAKLMQMARDAGVNFFDNAEVYAAGEAETVMGAALARLAWPRSSYVVSTKIFWGAANADPGFASPNDTGLSRKHVLEGLAASLARLGLAYVDIVFAHRPDYDTPVEETVAAFSDAVARGHALYWGTSEWPADRIAAAREHALARGLHPPVCEQPQYSLLDGRARVEVEYGPLYDAGWAGLGLTTWSPLASGVLTGKYAGGVAPPGSRLASDKWGAMLAPKLLQPAVLAKADALGGIAARMGVSPAALAIAWCCLNPRVSTVILGASKPDQLADNLTALAVLARLRGDDAGVVDELEAVFGSKPEAVRTFR